jgi:hypothetical protein
VLKNYLVPTVENKSHVIKGNSDFNDLRRTYDHITFLETEESMELVLCCNYITLGSTNHLETTKGSKMSYVARECYVASLLKDGEKQEKGILFRLDFGHFNDDRSHWDLNTPMEFGRSNHRL